MKKTIAVLLSVLMMFAFFGCSAKEDIEVTETTTTTTTTTEAPKPTNPFTGESDYPEVATTLRPVSIVVENLRPARPQWGIKSPDIICEGEVEGGISRMLWVYANVNDVPNKVGPIRSARPSFVEFSTFFDSIYIHWGGSHSKKSYTGGYETIKKLGVNDIDGMNGGKLFGRDTTRSTSSEHRGILDGTKILAKAKDKGYRTKIDESKMSTFSFNETIADAGTTPATKMNVKFSNRTDTRKFTFKDDKKYHTGDWETDVAFENVIVLMAESTYITVPYKGSSTTYLNYKWTSGNGYYASNGKATNITWSIENNKLVLKDTAGKELNLNVGNSYIGFASSNHEGKVTFPTE